MMKYEVYKELYKEAIGYDNKEYYIGERGWQQWMDGYSADEVAIILEAIYKLANATLKDTREGSRAEFARRYNIPVRTLENWEAGTREAPAYVKELINYTILITKFEEMKKMNRIKALQEKYDRIKQQENQGWAYAEDYIDVKERISVEDQLFNALTLELLESMDEEEREGTYDVYYQPNTKTVWFEGGWGMAYSGDDKAAFKVLQIEGGEIV